MDKHSKMKLMRRKNKLFPWLRAFCGKYSEKFFGSEKSEIFEYLFMNVDKEMKQIYLELNKEKTEDFFNILNSLFLHFWWQIRWKSCKKWKAYWKKVQFPDVSTNDSHRKCCVQLLYYMILLSIFLTGGDEMSDWIGRILTAIKSLPDAIDILCSALLLINDLKIKHKPIYNIILKHALCCETVKNATEPQTYCKIILLFRRLLKLTKDKKEKSQILLFTSKLRVPCDIQHWLSSQNIEDSNYLNYDNLTQELLTRSYPDELLRKLSEILIEHGFCKEKSSKVNSVDADRVLSKVTSKENISEDSSNVPEPDEDLLDSLIKGNIQNNLNNTKAITSCIEENTSYDTNNMIKDKDLHSEVLNQVEEICGEANVNHCSELLKKASEKEKCENEESERHSHKKKKKDKILKEPSKDYKKNKKHKKDSKDKLGTTSIEINEDFGTDFQSIQTESCVSKKVLDQEIENSVDAYSEPSNVTSKENISEDSNSVSEPDEDLLHSLFRTNIISDLNYITFTAFSAANSDINNMDKDLYNEVLNPLEDICGEKNGSELIGRASKKRKHENEKGVHKKKKKDSKKNKKRKKKSKEKPGTAAAVEINEEFDTYSQSSIVKSGIEKSNVSKKALHKGKRTSHKKSKSHKREKKSREKPNNAVDLNAVMLDVEESHAPKETVNNDERAVFHKQKNHNSEAEKKKSKNGEKKQNHSKKSKKHSKKKASTKSTKNTDVHPGTNLLVENFPESQNPDKYIDMNEKKKQNHIKKSKKHSKEKKSPENKKATDLDDIDIIVGGENFSESENGLPDTENQNQRIMEKHSKEKLKKSSKRRKIADFNKPDKVLEYENLLLQTENNQFDKSIEESDGEKFKTFKKDKLKKMSVEKNSPHFPSEDTNDISSLGKEDSINKPIKPSKLRKKKLFNYDLYCLTEGQKEIAPNKTINNCLLLPENFTSNKNSSFSNNDPKLHTQDIDMPSANSNDDLNLSSDETTTFSNVSIAELLKPPKVQIYRHNAAFGIEDRHTSLIKTKRKLSSEDLKKASTEHNWLTKKNKLCDSEQESEISSLKNDLLLASKKILDQSCISEPCSSPSLFDNESVSEGTENNDSESNGPYKSNKWGSTSMMITKHSNESTAIVQQSHFMHSTADTFLSVGCLSEQSFKEVSTQKSSSEHSFDSFSHSSLTPSVVLKDVLQCKSAQKYITASEKSFTSSSESDSKTPSCNSPPTVTNLEMNVSQELTLENIAKVNALFGENESALIDYLCSDEKDNSFVPIVDNSNHRAESCKLQTSTSPLSIQTANNILLNRSQSQFLTNESEAQKFNIEGENLNYKSVGTATETISSNDFGVNCNINNYPDQNSNKISSVQVIINFTGNNECPLSKKRQFVANFDFQTVNNSVRTLEYSNPIPSTQFVINNIPSLNLTPNCHPHFIPFNQATNSIEKSVISDDPNYSNTFCRPEEIGQCVGINDSGLTQNLFAASSPIVNNSYDRTECRPQLSLNSVALDCGKDNSVSQNVNSKYLSTENVESLNRESSELFLDAEASNNNSSYRTSTIYSDASDNDNDSSISAITTFSDFQTELSVGENLEIRGSPKSSNVRRNKLQVESEPESPVKTEFSETPQRVKLESFNKDNAQSKQFSEGDGSISKSTSKGEKTPKKIISPVYHRSAESTKCSGGDARVSKSTSEGKKAPTKIISQVYHCSAESTKCSEGDVRVNKSTSKGKKTPKKIISPVYHRYNLRRKKSLLTPKPLVAHLN